VTLVGGLFGGEFGRPLGEWIRRAVRELRWRRRADRADRFAPDSVRRGAPSSTSKRDKTSARSPDGKRFLIARASPSNLELIGADARGAGIVVYGWGFLLPTRSAGSLVHVEELSPEDVGPRMAEIAAEISNGVFVFRRPRR
jgi:hypothetical protein